MKYWFVCILLVCWTLDALAGPPAPAIIPLPVQLQTNAGTFTLCLPATRAGLPALATTPILADALSMTNAQYLAAVLLKSTGCRFSIFSQTGSNTVKGAILLTTASARSSLGAEGYELTVAPDSVVIRAPAEAGVFYGIQSLLQLLPPEIYAQQPVAGVSWIAPCVYVLDQPRFSWRGWMMDCSRHFFTKQEVKQCLDMMAMHKLNTFHWHLADDEGWRIQILAYPLLTQTGGWRNGIDFGMDPRASTDYNPTNSGLYGGFYTQADIREIVAYAQQRFITIVPEIELPAHCSAMLAAYPQFGCGNAATVYNQTNINYGVDLISPAGPGTMAFVEEILMEVMGLFPGQYIHCGGDEVIATGDTQWDSYSYDVAQMQALGITPSGSASRVAYQHWFSTNIASFLQAKGRTMCGWTEFENGGVVPNALLTDWETGSSSEAVPVAEASQKVVMTPDTLTYLNYYMITNLAVEPYFEVGGTPSYLLLSNVYNFEPVPGSLPAQYVTNIIGAEATEFAECIPSLENLEMKALPRLSAMAELCWTPAAEKNFTSFSQRLVTQQQRFTEMGVNYDHTNAIQIGSWTAPVSTTATTVNYDITPYVHATGEIDVDFASTSVTSPTKGLNIFSTALLVNGVQVDVDNFNGFAWAYQTLPGQLPVLILHLASYKPGATYTIQASIAGYKGATTSGIVYLTNWN
jgi:hexosaminidase